MTAATTSQLEPALVAAYTFAESSDYLFKKTQHTYFVLPFPMYMCIVTANTVSFLS